MPFQLEAESQSAPVAPVVNRQMPPNEALRPCYGLRDFFLAGRTETRDAGRNVIWCHFCFSFCFWLTNAADTRPLHTFIRRLVRNLTKNLLVAQLDDFVVMADYENDTIGNEFAK